MLEATWDHGRIQCFDVRLGVCWDSTVLAAPPARVPRSETTTDLPGRDLL
ncbi:hypothetical protein [Nocardiopsis alkaliphila]|nr:hypothetical protein [Nocardiopsis alkaliphila]